MNATTLVQFQVPGAGTVILEATVTYPLNQLGLIARGPDSNVPDRRNDGPTRLRMEFPVTAQNLAKGNTWTVFTTLRGVNGMIYAIPGRGVVGELKVSFVLGAPAQKTALIPKSVPNLGAAGQPTRAAAPPASNVPTTAKIVDQPVAKRQVGTIQQQAPGAAAAAPRNPSGFTAKAGAGGDVILKWKSVPKVISYNLQGPGVPSDPKTGMPPNVTGTTYTVKGLPGGTHSWALFAVYSGPSGPYFGDESNPARTSITVVEPASGRYRVTINGFRANSATWDTALQTDGKGDEIFIVAELQEMSAGGNPAGSIQTRTSFIHGDANGFPSRIAAGSLSPSGGIRSGDGIPNVPEPWKRYGPLQQKQFPMFVWEGRLVDGQNAVLIIPAIWEQDRTDRLVAVYNDATGIFGVTFKPYLEMLASGQVDLAALDKLIFGKDAQWDFTKGDILRPDSALLNMIYAGSLRLGGDRKKADAASMDSPLNYEVDRLIRNWLGATTQNVIGESKDRPIGMKEKDGGYVFDPQVITLNYRTAEASLAPNAMPLGPGVLELRYIDAPRLAGDYTLYVQIEKIP